jgi:hypothetical protein
MNRSIAIVLFIALVGCSKSAPQNASSEAAASVAAAPASAPAGNACDRKLLTAADLSGLLKGTITIGPLPGDPQSCIFSGGGDQITVSLRPGVGDMTVQTVLSGGENVSATPVAGVGDRAAWTSELHEINATKANLLCDIQAPGETGATQQSLGALCNKIFAGA